MISRRSVLTGTAAVLGAMASGPLGSLPAAGAAAAAGSAYAFTDRMRQAYRGVGVEFRPEVRWWLAEGLNTDATLRANVKQIADLGFGAAEFLAMPEEGADDKTYGWGSDEWTHDSRLVIEEATARGLGFSLTSGTHWATANLPDTYTWDGATFDYDNKAASKELDYATVLLQSGEAFEGALPRAVKPKQSADSKENVFEGVVAAKITKPRKDSGQTPGYGQGTGTGELDFGSLTDLSDKVVRDNDTYSLKWTAPDDGQYALFVYWMHGTGETFEPSTSKNYTINYVDRYGIDALKDYWEANVLTPELKETMRHNGRGEIYMDSLELASYGAAGVLWGHHFKDEFRTRRGYDVTPYLPVVSWDKTRHDSDAPPEFDYAVARDADTVRVQKIRNDVNQTFSELYEENVLKPLQAWLHGLGMKLRAEPSYGMVYEISTPAKYLDGVETETFAQNGDLDVYRGMLGSAHMYGRPFSSETGAVGGRNYYYDMDYWTRIAYLQFAGGVNRTVFHGYSAIEGSEADTHWPGHEGMYSFFSERFGGRQPASMMYPEWTKMLGRIQKVLRQGKPRRDLAILRTDNAFISYGQPRANTPAENSYFMNDKPYFWRDLTLQHAGYTYDYFSPQLLEDEANVRWTRDELQSDGPGYQAVILYQDSLELAAAKRLLAIAKGGLPVLFVNNTSEIRSHEGPEITYEKAASTTRFVQDSEEELGKVVARIKTLRNVAEVERAGDALAALKKLGVEPRVAYTAPNDTIMTISRLDEKANVLYTFAYNFKFEKNKGKDATTFTLSMAGRGKPHTIDVWTGAVDPVGTYDIRGGHTHVELSLKPGEAAVITLDLKDRAPRTHAVATTADRVIEDGARLSVLATRDGTYTTTLSDGRTARSRVRVPDPIPLERWDITVQDWNEGDRKVNTETKFGHETKEVYYTTKKTDLSFPDSRLTPWKDLPATDTQLSQLAGDKPSMAHVSGLGTYETTFQLPRNWNPNNGAYLRIGSTNGDQARILVNGRQAPGLDLRALQVDISQLLRRGEENTIKIVIATTLTNRLLQRGYETQGGTQDYGLTGDVSIVPYTVVDVSGN
ncbi:MULTISPECIES: glycosyl hydrolase [unclassified Streptomyces]|uniref:glycosyl hydrolase n=1 Tax=unclassified Streptomyces TaxID=2593676 RepID=UPI002E185C47|nr:MULTISPECIES: glycosyl hydrolase [unclassified Streptomyces]